MIGLLLAGTALAQVSSVSAPDFALTDCVPHPIAGTVPFHIAEQAIDTNAQVYGAVAFAEEVLLADGGSFWGLRMHNLYNVTRLPTAAACPTELQWGSAGLDLYASSSGLLIPLFMGNDDLDVRLFYAGSVTGSVLQFPSDRWGSNRVFTGYGYAGAAIGFTYAAPAAPLLTNGSGVQQMVGDFVAGTEVSLPKHPDVASLRAGYVYSQGLYSNLNSRRLRLFATALLTDQFALLALAKGGLDKVVLPWEKAGKTSLFGRNQVLKGPSPATEPDPGATTAQPGAADDAGPGKIDLTTLHFQQHDIGGYLDVSAAYALLPRPFLHEGSATLKLPGELVGLPEGMPLFTGTIGVTEMPAMPWYAVEGGRQVYLDISLADVVHIRRNDPATLVVFPYAQNATEFSIEFDVPTSVRGM